MNFIRLKTFKVTSEATWLFGLTYSKTIFMLAGFTTGINMGEHVSDSAGLLLGGLFAVVMFFGHNLYRKLFPSKRFESMMRFFFMQADVYKPRQDKKYFRVSFVKDE